MSKVTFNLVGDIFTHLTGGNKGYSTAYKESKYLIWKNILSGNDNSAEITFYLEPWVKDVLTDKHSKKKYLWILESREVHKNCYDEITSNFEIYENLFDVIFTHDLELLSKSSKCKFVPAMGFWIKDIGIKSKSKLISMISSNKNQTSGQKLRLDAIEKYKNRLDLFGRGFNPIKNKEEGLNDYMFSIVIENSKYDSYFTEKILDCFVTGTIPVYWGTSDIGKFFNLDGIILYDDNFDISSLSLELYNSKMDAIKDNYNRALNYEMAEDYIYLN